MLWLLWKLCEVIITPISWKRAEKIRLRLNFCKICLQVKIKSISAFSHDWYRQMVIIKSKYFVYLSSQFLLFLFPEVIFLTRITKANIGGISQLPKQAKCQAILILLCILGIKVYFLITKPFKLHSTVNGIDWTTIWRMLLTYDLDLKQQQQQQLK